VGPTRRELGENEHYYFHSVIGAEGQRFFEKDARGLPLLETVLRRQESWGAQELFGVVSKAEALK
jgi:hypothetical protein